MPPAHSTRIFERFADFFEELLQTEWLHRVRNDGQIVHLPDPLRRASTLAYRRRGRFLFVTPGRAARETRTMDASHPLMADNGRAGLDPRGPTVSGCASMTDGLPNPSFPRRREFTPRSTPGGRNDEAFADSALRPGLRPGRSSKVLARGLRGCKPRQAADS